MKKIYLTAALLMLATPLSAQAARAGVKVKPMLSTERHLDPASRSCCRAAMSADHVDLRDRAGRQIARAQAYLSALRISAVRAVAHHQRRDRQEHDIQARRLHRRSRADNGTRPRVSAPIRSSSGDRSGTNPVRTPPCCETGRHSGALTLPAAPRAIFPLPSATLRNRRASARRLRDRARRSNGLFAPAP